MTRLLALTLALTLALAAFAAGTLVTATQPPRVEVRDRIIVEPRTLPPVTVRVTERVTVAARADRSERRVAPVRATGTVREYQAYAVRGLSSTEASCMVELWTKESGWSPRAVSPSGRHVGIPQLLGLKLSDGWKHQITRGLSYIASRYDGSPCRALAHYNANRWY